VELVDVVVEPAERVSLQQCQYLLVDGRTMVVDAVQPGTALRPRDRLDFLVQGAARVEVSAARLDTYLQEG